jgi:hypothetical protein
MVDRNTFLTTLYVMVDDFCKSRLPAETRTGPKPSLSRSEVVTLALFGQWYRFRSQRDFYRMAEEKLRSAFPTLPHRTQFNRLARRHREAIVAFSLYLVELMRAREVAYEILDTTGVPVRNVKRRGNGWLGGDANIGWCTRLGWYYGFRLLISVTPSGVITGFGFAEGSAKEQPMTETMLALRNQVEPAIPSVGKPALGYYVADQGFAGDKTHKQWRILYGGDVISEPQINSKAVWPKKLRRWLHSIRQLVETVYSWQMEFFRLDKIRPHDITGFHTALAAKVALHNFCIWLNERAGRPLLAFADLLGW